MELENPIWPKIRAKLKFRATVISAVENLLPRRCILTIVCKTWPLHVARRTLRA